ncbi:Uncharacterised protein [Mycobacteroides abscessus subsp. abscessus]|uniref:hypothetical protein n=1 Tax=Mycobacteroides abscessus TaxID=36809 RepID=UPI00092AEC6F|nr:hypothetical protein [Mycobacteroides abscessus]MBE5513772.1 hypothetical protein [Mycobacteroides abscessus]MBN7327681.1 hypothetical protein [Mycobacteroides abscessus subsp. abscessus]SID61871.1 Uncharacterised protein [Mycobacteroides abscessus subsp. abscessus]SIE83802.1 Uncharacterised protein [Mycobacteroides abscessus subsp. abscessus]SIF72174.1 Uncharacterised protein [Mycobacteroides abscessus subsp. abscessus]
MAHMQIPAPRTSVPPISTAGMSRAFVRMLEDAVRRGDHAEALKIARGAEVHFAWVAAHPEAVAK